MHTKGFRALQRRYRQPAVMVFAIVSVGVGGWWLQELSGPQTPNPARPASPQPRPWIEPPRLENKDLAPRSSASVVPADSSAMLRHQFQVAVTTLAHGETEPAAEQFRAIVSKAPGLVEAWVNLGFAELQSKHCDEAVSAFQQALELRPAQANAYYGLAICHEVEGDLARARGAMQTFVHLAPEKDPFLPRARAALWQWQRTGTVDETPKSPDFDTEPKN